MRNVKFSESLDLCQVHNVVEIAYVKHALTSKSIQAWIIRSKGT